MSWSMRTAQTGAPAQRKATVHVVAVLRSSLSELLGQPLESPQSAVFDTSLRAAVQTFQRQQRLEPDGVAGARTLIALNNALGLPDRPRLNSEL